MAQPIESSPCRNCQLLKEKLESSRRRNVQSHNNSDTSFKARATRYLDNVLTRVVPGLRRDRSVSYGLGQDRGDMVDDFLFMNKDLIQRGSCPAESGSECVFRQLLED